MAERPGEFELIERLFRPLADGFEGAFGLTDDAAVIPLGAGRVAVATQDALVAGVHFPAGEAPEAVAAKALRVNLSDLAAMGAEPVAYLLALALPAEVDLAWLERFADALGRDQRRYAIALAGGDTVATPGPLMIAITAIGAAEPGRVLRRNGARAGDAVFVSGTIGDAALGLDSLAGRLPAAVPAEVREALVARLRYPEPRLALGRALVGVASAAIDVSDGLAADLGHVAAASAVAAELRAASVPLSAAARAVLAAAPALITRVLAGGDDYELLFTAPAKARDAVLRAAAAAGVPVTEIGEIRAGSGVRAVAADGTEVPLGAGGWTHF
ncbi:MAG TPA: thiamine-phosphate kinase [Alphaproteobacteria bacterium]